MLTVKISPGLILVPELDEIDTYPDALIVMFP
jgi:hypothetical protein